MKLLARCLLSACLVQGTLAFTSPGVQQSRSLASSCFRRSLAIRGGAGTSMAAQQTLYVKQAAGGTGLGDCPFCHKAHMALKLRKIEFACEYINLADKPKWYLELNDKGSVPTLKGEGGTLITDSEEIVAFADSDGKGEGPKLTGQDGADEVGGLAVGVWKAFATLMKNKDDAAEEGLVADFRRAVGDLDSYLSSGNKRFLLGDEPSAVDCKTGPFLLHASVALPHYKKIDAFEGAAAVQAYFKNLQGLTAFRETSYGDSVIIAGWAKFFT